MSGKKYFERLAICCLLGIVAMFITNCATIMSGTKQKIDIISDPPEADIIIKEARIAKTPAVIELNRKEKHAVIRIEKEGYETVEVNLSRTFNKWYTYNFFSFLLIGFIVDPLTGAAYSLDPQKIDVWLQKINKNERSVMEKWNNAFLKSLY